MPHHAHPYAVQTAAMYLSAIPTLAALGLIVGAQLEKARRSAAPAPARTVPRLATVLAPLPD
jgi:hypothetical protein